jgi:hypothetical protein
MAYPGKTWLSLVLSRAPPSPRERFLGHDDIKSTCLVAMPCPQQVTFTGERLFNAFLTLGLRWTVRDQYGRVRQYLRDTDAKAWRAHHEPKTQPSGRSLRLSLYPSSSDRQKILDFFSRYGPDFRSFSLSLFLPPDHKPLVELLDEQGAVLRPYVHPDRQSGDPIDIFSEFCGGYFTFVNDVDILLGQHIPAASPASEYDVIPTDLTGHAVENLALALNLPALHVSRLAERTVAASFELQNGLAICYAALWEQYLSDQPRIRRCADPSCDHFFFAQKPRKPTAAPAMGIV